MEFLPPAFADMAQFSQFVIYKLIPSLSRPGKYDKIPINPITLENSNWKNKDTWLSFNEALSFSKKLGSNIGVGFVFTEDDPFFFLDIDNCFDIEKNKWMPEVNMILNHFQGAAVEVSSSGKGIHVFAKSLPIKHSCTSDILSPIKLELYTHNRFVALTGVHAEGTSGIDLTEKLRSFNAMYFSNSNTPIGNWLDKWNELETKGREPSWNGNTDDNELLQRALKSVSKDPKSIFGSKATFQDLWNKNVESLQKTYPDSSKPCGYNESSADAALAQHLAFWTGNDVIRMRRLMLQSSLVREKWDRDDYLPRTIVTACDRQKEWLCDKPLASAMRTEESIESPKPVMIDGNTFVSVPQQIELFKGCVYVADEHRIMIPGGYLFNAERFRVIYGGYSFPMDNANQKVTKNAWEVFTESQVIKGPRCDTTAFRPDLVPGSIHRLDGEGGQTFVNIYYPVKTPRIRGDATPITNHLKILVPNDHDRLILTSYLAATVQYQGTKFRWCILIQGVEGNGKSLISMCIAFIISRRYSHFPNPAEIGSKFNDWMYAKNFIGIEDIYSGDVKYDMVEALKIKIDARRQEIESKGGAKIMRDICANFIINTNHKDGLRKTRNDRRFAPFFTAQQSVEDLKRDGLTSDYFFNLHQWLEKKDGMAITHDYLMTFDIPDEYNPATFCQRAPITSSTEIAIEQSRGSIEQEIIEAVEQNLIGFKGGWISSKYLDELLRKLNRSFISYNRRHEILKGLGYHRHPGLKDGRVNNTILPDGAKSRLYLRENHEHHGLISPTEIAKAYTKAQEDS